VRASWLYAACVGGVVIGLVGGGEGIIGALAIALFVSELKYAFSSRRGRELLWLLKATAKTQAVLAAVLVVTFYMTR
jgi:ABC-type lipoprotein release transport system permease subunit